LPKRKRADATGLPATSALQKIKPGYSSAFKSGGGVHFTLLQVLGPAKVGPIATVATMAPVAIRIPTVRRTANNRLVDIVPSRGAFHVAEERYKPRVGGVHFTLAQSLGPARVGPIATVATTAPVAIRIPTVKSTANMRLADIFPSRRPFHRQKKDRNPEDGLYHYLSSKDKLQK
jgi:hypothetical protein